MKRSKMIIAMSLAIGCSATSATPYDWVTTGASSKSSDQLYVGLNWRQGGGAIPAFVLGYMSIKTKTNGDTNGFDLAFHTELAGGARPGKIKLSYLDGKEDWQGMLGVGYDFLKSAPLLKFGINIPHLIMAVDAYHGFKFVPNVTIHTLGEFDKPQQNTVCDVVTGGRYTLPNCTNPGEAPNGGGETGTIPLP